MIEAPWTGPAITKLTEMPQSCSRLASTNGQLDKGLLSRQIEIVY